MRHWRWILFLSIALYAGYLQALVLTSRASHNKQR